MSKLQWTVVIAMAALVLFVVGAVAVGILLVLTQPGTPVLVAAVVPSLTASPAGAEFPPTWTPTPATAPQPSPSPRPSVTPQPTATHFPTLTPSPTPTPTPLPTPVLQNPGFQGISGGAIPGWVGTGFANYTYGQEGYDPDTSYAAPTFQQADDPRRFIDGPTLQIGTIKWVKFRAYVYQVVALPPGSRVTFEVRSAAFAETGGISVAAGIDPNGADHCNAAQWGSIPIVNQDSGVITLRSPEMTVGAGGSATVCLYAETQYAQVSAAAYFDQAVLTLRDSVQP